MNQHDYEAYLTGLSNVTREMHFGYSFFFVGDDRRLPFATIADSDNEYDDVSDLNRAGVFRLNIGVGKETFDTLAADLQEGPVDYAVLNEFMPHPQYARQFFVCILNPAGTNADKAKRLIAEAHALAEERLRRKSP